MGKDKKKTAKSKPKEKSVSAKKPVKKTSGAKKVTALKKKPVARPVAAKTKRAAPKPSKTKAVVKTAPVAKAPAKKAAPVAKVPAKKAAPVVKAPAKPVKPEPKPVAAKKPEVKAAVPPVKRPETPASAPKKPVVPSAPLPAPAPHAPPLSIDKALRQKLKILPREFLVELATNIRTAITPAIAEARGREIVGQATSGDATFELDRIAEKALLAFLKNARMPVAYYSEDSGYTTFTNAQPQNLLIIDPIDGTRAAKCGFEACTISIASTRVIERPSMADIDNGCVMEIMNGRVFYAERGKGTRINQGEHVRRPKLSKNTHLEMIAWSMTVPARPADLIFPTAAKLIDLSSLKGGFFACNSTSFSLTRLLTNQLDACVDFANRYLRDIPGVVRDHFINAGRGQIVSIAPYDIAAAVLIAQEAGCVVTDAYGKSLNDVLLLDTSVENQRSLIAAANAKLHQKLFSFFDMRITQYEKLLKLRAERAANAANAP